MDEIALLTPLFAGVNYKRLEGYKSLQWPVAADGTDEPLLYTNGFAFPDGKGRLFPVTWIGPTDSPNAEFDLHLNNGRLLEHFHEGNLTFVRMAFARKLLTLLSKSLPNLRKNAGFKVVLGCNWSPVTARYAFVR